MTGSDPSPQSAERASWRTRLQPHHDFLLLLVTFVTFRLASVWFLRPGGYIRDYSDLIYYRSRASWQDFGFLPYRDYWSEYPPLFAWFSVWIDRIARLFPVWEDDRFWYAAFFGAAMVAAETITFVSLYILARRLYGDRGLRVSWLYAGLFLPVYMLAGWYDALPVMTILLALTIMLTMRSGWGMALAGLVTGIGGLLKLVPLAILAVTPLVTRRWRDIAIAVLVAAAVVAGVYAYAYVTGPTMTMASVRSLTERTGWSTLYALADGFLRLGKVVGDPFDPHLRGRPVRPAGAATHHLAGLAGAGRGHALFARRRQRPPQEDWRVVTFAGFTYAVLLLAYPAWNPQYALYLLPFLVLVWPNARGLAYALLLSFFVLLEHPVYFNLIGPNYPPTTQAILGVDYTRSAVGDRHPAHGCPCRHRRRSGLDALPARRSPSCPASCRSRDRIRPGVVRARIPAHLRRRTAGHHSAAPGDSVPECDGCCAPHRLVQPRGRPRTAPVAGCA